MAKRNQSVNVDNLLSTEEIDRKFERMSRSAANKMANDYNKKLEKRLKELEKKNK